MNDDTMVNLRIEVAKLEAKLHSAEHSLVVAKESMEKRLDSMNEFRDTLRDQAGKFVTRVELFGFFSTAMFLTIAVVTLWLKFTKGGI